MLISSRGVNSAMNPDERMRAGERILEEMLGTEPAAEVRMTWRKICPDFEAYVLEFLAGEIWTRPGLDRRTKSLVTIAALAALGRVRGLTLNLRMALHNGVDRREVVETLLHIAPYAGFPAAWDALAMADQVFREADS
jgi:alkylhydroperoxidase/carboxymuconolactone decarboxylase family protein YurZ